MFGIDTFAWFKLIYLKNNGWEELIKEILDVGAFFITHDVKKEFEHFFPDELDLLNRVDIYKVTDEEKKKFSNEKFDEAEVSLLVFTDKKDYVIITEDHPMLDEGISSKKNIIQLVDYFRILNRGNFLSNREFYHLVKKLRAMKNITQDKEKKMIKN